MAGTGYLDKKELVRTASAYLKELKAKYGLTTFVDCTPVNIGRDVEVLRQVAEQTEMNLVCSTGFYYTDEPVLSAASSDRLCKYMVEDALSVNAGVIKCAVEAEQVGPFQEKVLRACARVHLHLGLPIVLHTNANNKNARKALEIMISEDVKPDTVTVSHLSDTDETEYIGEIADCGCFIGLDRLHGNTSEAYISKTVQKIKKLCEEGYEDRIVLSHDTMFFNGFEASPAMDASPRFSYCFEHILPELPAQTAEQIMVSNPARMLTCQSL